MQQPKITASERRYKKRNRFSYRLFWLLTLIILPPWHSSLGWFLTEENRNDLNTKVIKFLNYENFIRKIQISKLVGEAFKYVSFTNPDSAARRE